MPHSKSAIKQVKKLTKKASKELKMVKVELGEMSKKLSKKMNKQTSGKSKKAQVDMLNVGKKLVKKMNKQINKVQDELKSMGKK